MRWHYRPGTLRLKSWEVQNYTAFITRAEGMNNIATVEKKDTKNKEEKIRQIILNISL